MKAMTRDEVFFADTYAILAIIFKNPAYEQFLDCTLVTAKGNIAELYYILLREHNQTVAEGYCRAFFAALVPVSYDAISEGMQFKLANRKENLSYVDCVGYATAGELSVPFLTGDQKFQNKENVEWVK